MDEKSMTFGKYIKALRKERKLTMQQVADYLKISSKGNISDIECDSRPPFKDDKMKLFIEFLKLNDEETAMLYELAGKYKGKVSYDIRGIYTDGEVGKLASVARRISKEVSEPMPNWKEDILRREAEKERDKTDGGDESC